MPADAITLQTREPLGVVQKNKISAATMNTRKASNRRARGGAGAAANKHVNRVRASRSAGDVGGSGAFRARSEMRPSSAKVFQNIFGGDASASSASAMRVSASKSATDMRQGAGDIDKREPAPRERLAARRRQQGASNPGKLFSVSGKASTRTGSTINGGGSSSSRFVKAVQTLEPNSRQALLSAIKAERETRTLQQQHEEEFKTMRQEATDALAATRAQHASASIFDVFKMIDAVDPLIKYEGGRRMLHFCLVVSTACPTMLRKAQQIYEEMLSDVKDTETLHSQRLDALRVKHEKFVLGQQRKHKEEMSELGKSLSDEYEALKAERDDMQLRCSLAESQAAEMQSSLHRELERAELLVAQVTVLKRENATRMPQRILPPADGDGQDSSTDHVDTSKQLEESEKQLKELRRERDRQAQLLEINARSITALESKCKLETAKRNSLERQLEQAQAATNADGKGASSAAPSDPAEEPAVEAMAAATAEELKKAQTRLRKLHHASKKDKAEIAQLQEALAHARAQLQASAEQQEVAQQKLGDYSNQLQELKMQHTKGGAPTLNLERGGGLPEELNGCAAIDIDETEAVPDFGSGPSGCENPPLDGMFGGNESGLSAVAAESSFVDATGGAGLDTTFFVGEETAVAGNGREAELVAENAALRAQIAALQARAPADFHIEPEDDEELPDIEISKQLMAENHIRALPLARPAAVPSLDFNLMAKRLETLDAEEIAEAEAEAAAAAEKGESVVLEEVVDPNYKPSEEDIREYAMFLGIDPECEPKLMHIAEQGLMAPLPPDWKPCAAPSGEIYYFNFSNGDSVWDHPGDEYYKSMVKQERRKTKATRSSD